MKMDQIRVIAKDMGLKPGKKNKTDLVREIQLNEGNFDCFASAISGDCDQQECIWREDCFATAKKSKAA